MATIYVCSFRSMCLITIHPLTPTACSTRRRGVPAPAGLHHAHAAAQVRLLRAGEITTKLCTTSARRAYVNLFVFNTYMCLDIGSPRRQVSLPLRAPRCSAPAHLLPGRRALAHPQTQSLLPQAEARGDRRRRPRGVFTHPPALRARTQIEGAYCCWYLYQFWSRILSPLLLLIFRKKALTLYSETTLSFWTAPSNAACSRDS